MSSVLEMLGAEKVGFELVSIEKIEVREMPRPLNEDYVRQLVELIESGTTLPPSEFVG